jgi:hypothetical protein
VDLHRFTDQHVGVHPIEIEISNDALIRVSWIHEHLSGCALCNKAQSQSEHDQFSAHPKPHCPRTLNIDHEESWKRLDHGGAELGLIDLPEPHAPGRFHEVDAFDGQKLKGHIDSLAGGTGARFSLLPPDNASGNFTKVVQRVPVLVRIDGIADLDLRPGLSAKVTVVTK